jgi:tetratricopeptide (TPR) repeat protein
MFKMTEKSSTLIYEFRKAERYYDSGKFREAEQCYRDIIKIKTSYKAYIKLGDTVMEQSNFKDAIRCYRDALAIRPNDAAALHRLGDALLLSGDPRLSTLSIACYQQVLEANPGDAHMHDALGMALFTLEEAEEAIKCFKKAL